MGEWKSGSISCLWSITSVRIWMNGGVWGCQRWMYELYRWLNRWIDNIWAVRSLWMFYFYSYMGILICLGLSQSYVCIISLLIWANWGWGVCQYMYVTCITYRLKLLKVLFHPGSAIDELDKNVTREKYIKKLLEIISFQLVN